MRKVSKFSVIFCTVVMASSCQSPVQRYPGSSANVQEWEQLRDLRQRKVELNALSVHFRKRKNEAQLEIIQKEEKSIDEKMADIENNIVETSGDSQHIENTHTKWRIEKEKIELSRFSLYELDKNVEFSVSTYEAEETQVTLTHGLFSSTGNGIRFMDNNPNVNFTIKCDAPFEAKYGVVVKKFKAMEKYKFNLNDNKLSKDSRTLIFPPEMNSCEVRFVNNLDSTKKVYGFKISNEMKKLSSMTSLLNSTEVCTLKKDTGKLFETDDFPSMTCPTTYDSIKILPEPEDSLHARAIALLGQDLPKDFIKNANPYAELDFSKAPKFDALLVSYLVFRADFYGTLMARLLAYHADKGAFVRVLVSQVITLDKDQAMYEKMMALHPNMKFETYKFEKSQQGGAWISTFHRTNHVKLFIGYSKTNPQDSFVILGGRNIHDGFAFKTPPDVSKFPEIVNYASGDESWAYWRDFEMVLHGQNFVESVARHYLNFYHINKENLITKISSVAVEKENALESTQETLRHYISIPFKDEPNLNYFYAKMIDSAEKKILISSPYFRPVKEIADALDRAIARGVDITIITRLDLEGDTADFILGAVNKDGVNRFIDKVKVYEYTEPKVILHSKLVMVDEKFTFISSVNLNKRSFYHDLENGVVINDGKFTMKMDSLYKEYLKLSEPLTEKQKIIFWKKGIIKIFDKVL